LKTQLKREENFMKRKETQDVEFKQSWRDEFLKEICGFANAKGGKLLIGVDDSGKAVGVANEKRLLEDIPNKIVSLLGIVPDVNLVEKNGVEIIEIVVSPSSVPILYHGICYYRSGTTKQELTGIALQQFILKKLGRSWDDVRNEYAT
jgi:ATP-dependent DNA helicase RecG